MTGTRDKVLKISVFFIEDLMEQDKNSLSLHKPVLCGYFGTVIQNVLLLVCKGKEQAIMKSESQQASPAIFCFSIG